MRRIPIEHLAPVEALEKPLYHETGGRLFKVGEPLDRACLLALGRADITAVWEFERGDNIAEFVRNANSVKIPVGELSASHKFFLSVYTEDGKLLVPEGTFCNPKIKARLEQMGLSEVAVVKDPPAVNPVEAFLGEKSRAKKEAARKKLARMALSQAKMLLQPKAVTVSEVEKELRTDLAGGKPEGEALDAMVDSGVKSRSSEDKARIETLFGDAVGIVDELLTSIRKGSLTDGNAVLKVARDEILQLVEDKDLLLNTLNMRSNGKAPLAHHSVKRTIVATNTASAMNYNQDQILEIALGALLADVGMLAVDGEIVNKSAELTDQERAKVQAHPALGLGLLKHLSNIPKSVIYAIYQHHERFDGSGYPKGSSQKGIHSFALIIAAADAYAAMISERPWRDPMLPYQAVESVIRGASVKHFDAGVVRGFLRYMSLFPIGSLVELSTGVIAKVVACSKTQYARPVVQPILEKKTGRPPANPTLLDLSLSPTARISRAVDPKEYLHVKLQDGF